MKKFIIYIFSVFLVSFLIIVGLFFTITYYKKNIFATSYQSVIQRKFNNLINTNEPKIILIGGSSLGFGLDEKTLEEATGYKVVNLGLHAGFGNLFNTEISKANIRDGDIVLLGYEYGWFDEFAFSELDLDLIMSGIDHNIEIYKYIPLEKYPLIFKNLFTYASKKSNYEGTTGTYSSFSFNEFGQMILKRENYIINDYENNKDYYGQINYSDVEISFNSIKYLQDFKKYVEDKKASIYFISPPVLKDAVKCDYQKLIDLKDLEEKLIGIKYISNPLDYIFNSNYMFDTIYHCNSKGESYRTELLINDLRKNKIIN